MRRPTSLLRPPWPEPYRLDHPQVQPVPTDPATVPTEVHDGRTEAGTALHAHGANMSTRCVLGKWVYLVTHAMSLFDLQDVCMVIGSLATLDLPMIVDLIGIFELKGPYCTITMVDYVLQALSVIPRGSWGDVARRFTMIRWVSPKMCFWSHKCCELTASYRSDPIIDRDYDEAFQEYSEQRVIFFFSSSLPLAVVASSPSRPAVERRSDRLDEEIPFAKLSLVF
ncbi:hypothetical protein F511_20461 [Dorcoceras hygrometricum]|uniref:Uncharacterized protein n=1 Tax=Dorcoceras hygrometricum TaxID=472368 RepID=A0A2Z7DD17_9LAMI|nr:hypothetical protein F511_20461 [Dorcoceras hygrometricum]